MKSSSRFIISILSTLQVSAGIKVLRTDPSLQLPDRFSEAELVNSSLINQPEITICLRFKTFQFSTHKQPWYAQSVLTYGDTATLYNYVGTDCEEKFPGCTLREPLVSYNSKLGEKNWEFFYRFQNILGS